MEISIIVDEESIKDHAQANAVKLVKDYLISYGGSSYMSSRIKDIVAGEIEAAVREVLLEKEFLKEAVRNQLKVKLKKELERALTKLKSIGD